MRDRGFRLGDLQDESIGERGRQGERQRDWLVRGECVGHCGGGEAEAVGFRT